MAQQIEAVRTRAAVQLDAWVQSKGGLRPAARELQIHHNSLSRWVNGRQVPRVDGPTSRAWLEERTGVPAPGWDALAGPPVPARQSRTAGTNGAPVNRKPAQHVPQEPKAPRRAPPPRTPPSPPPATPAAPPSIAELQERLRRIPAELAELRRSVLDGEVAVTSAETLRRLLEGEAKALGAAVTSSGVASVSEVEQLEALVLSCTASCEACKARVEDALRELKSS